MTADILRDLAEKEAVATPGPWNVDIDTEYGDYGSVLSQAVEGVNAADGSRVFEFADDYGHESGADAALIAAARNALPALLAVAEAAQVFIEKEDGPIVNYADQDAWRASVKALRAALDALEGAEKP